jgi:hypothetical protein
LLFLMLVITLGIQYYTVGWESLVTKILVVDVILWIMYWISHIAEKKFFPRNVR